MIEALEERLKELPPELKQEVADFVEFLIQKRLRRVRGKSTFRWAGALKDLGSQYTSVGLPHRFPSGGLGTNENPS